MQRYDNYKDSGVEWLGEVPSHWEIQPLRALFHDRREKNIGPKTDYILSVMKDIGVIPYDEKGNVGNKKSENIENYKVVYPGDLVVNKMNAIIGSLGISKYHGALSQVYFVLHPRDKTKANANYLGYLFKVKPFQQSLIKISKGMMELRESIEFDEFKKLCLPLPTLEEQERVVIFLDEKTAEIDAAIAKKERLIELLKEQKNILINRAVTRGLNPDVAMRDSGVEWIGKTPAHWEVASNRRYLRKIEQGSSPAIENVNYDSEYFVAKISVVKNGKYIDEEVKPIPKKHFKYEYKIQKGDFLMSRGNTPEFVADVCYVESSPSSLVMLPDLLYRLVYDSNKIDCRYMMYLFLSPVIRMQINVCARGSSSTMVKVSQNHIKSWFVINPPKHEQIEIANYLDLMDKKFNEVGLLTRDEISKLYELKADLITQTVSGKVKV